MPRTYKTAHASDTNSGTLQTTCLLQTEKQSCTHIGGKSTLDDVQQRLKRLANLSIRQSNFILDKINSEFYTLLLSPVDRPPFPIHDEQVPTNEQDLMEYIHEHLRLCVMYLPQMEKMEENSPVRSDLIAYYRKLHQVLNSMLCDIESCVLPGHAGVTNQNIPCLSSNIVIFRSQSKYVIESIIKYLSFVLRRL